MKQLITITLFACTLIFPVYTMAAEPIGTFIEVEGIVEKGQDNFFKRAETDTPIYLNDIIKTRTGAKTLIMFIDDTQISLGEGSKLEIDEYVYDPDNNAPPSGKFSVLKGAFLFTSGLISKTKNPDVEIETSYGSIGLRGTTVWGGLLEGKYGIYVQRGRVNVRNDSGEINLGVGQGTSIQSHKHKPRALGQWGGELISKAIRKTQLKNQDQIKQRIADMKAINQAKREGRLQEHKQKKLETIKENKGSISNQQKQRLQNKKKIIKKMQLNR